MPDKLLQSLGLPVVGPHFPAARESEDRIQITEGEGRFKLLIRHPKYGHWCGYVCIPADSWHRIENLMPQELFDYDGPGSDRIVWKDMQHGTMRDVDLFPGVDSIWVGFADLTVNDLPSGDIIQRLKVFENRIWSLRNAHSLA